MAAQNKSSKKRANWQLIVVAAVAACAAFIAVIVTNHEDAGKVNAGNTAADTAGNAAAGENDVKVIGEGESLVIPISEITETVQFYPVVVDGTDMEIIAVKASDGSIRTAFNTCQVCYSSGRGYYVQSGDYLVCQNCGSRFSADRVEVSSGGCNPYPIFEENKTVTEDSIEISYDYLKQAVGIFANWK